MTSAIGRPRVVDAATVSVPALLIIVACVVAVVAVACLLALRLGGRGKNEHGVRAASVPAQSEAGAGHRGKRQFRYYSYSDSGGRAVNEDAVDTRIEGTRSGKSICAVVADGLGGHGNGDVASQTAVRFILDEWTPEMEAEDLALLLEDASGAVRDAQSPASEGRTTAVVLSLGRGRARWANAGDSRLYHFVDGRLQWQTADHSVSQMAVMLGDITPDQIRGHEDRARLFKALGQDEELKADSGELEVTSGMNAYLLCTDGFWEYVLEDEMEDALRGASSPAEWVASMLDIHDQRAPEDCDNNSAVAIWLSSGVVYSA